jgi:hypothetical protein
MPKLRRVQAAQAYILQPIIQTGYIIIKGGCGTVKAIVTEQPMLISQAITSTVNLNELLCQSDFTHCQVGSKRLFHIFLNYLKLLIIFHLIMMLFLNFVN